MNRRWRLGRRFLEGPNGLGGTDLRSISHAGATRGNQGHRRSHLSGEMELVQRGQRRGQLPQQQETPREETIEPIGVKENEQTEALEELEHLVEEQNVSPN